ncbi:hybrid sensor histidine kinase/response regulator [Sulfurimonas microaerophilic]|uniref:hybrid sensor histidine kinase/response regulator n=1 Tax=Sulfurimonas microaerophilic TaxID=3058392 RepID=UPI00271479C2|nr:response regulator [Sulfurimonas sp. hsl 1-7]
MSLEEVSILLVEDEDSSREMLKHFLEQLEFAKIYTAKDGKEGYECFLNYQPDLILTDLSMPIMDGLVMSEKIKSITSHVPILLITTRFEKEITERAVDIGIEGYLFKPISFDRLEKLLYKYAHRVLLERNLTHKMKLLNEYKRAIDVSSAVTKTDTNGTITYVNDAFCKMLGYSREELIGHKHNLVKHADTPPGTYEDLWKTITQKKVWKGRIKNRKKNGKTSYEYSIIVPILNEDNEIVEFIALRQDITDLFYQEEYLKRRIQEEVDKNLLETKFSTIGRMAAGITHEINTPLTYIKGNIELMLQDIQSMDDTVKQKDYLLEDSKTLLDGVHRIASIVESMREMASQKQEVPQPTNVYASLITALTLAYNKAKQISEIRIQNEIFKIGMDKEKFKYIADVQQQRIEQVLVIIINNALDALKRIDDFSQRLLEITVEREDEFIVVRIQDNGGGIDEKILPNIFDPFESNKEEGGMGIGLNVAKRIIDDHNGKIIPSNHENGALFEVYLPIKGEL